MLETWKQWRMQSLQVSFIVTQVNRIPFINTVLLVLKAGVSINKSKTATNMAMAFQTHLLEAQWQWASWKVSSWQDSKSKRVPKWYGLAMST